jgi:hypothetical protein
MSGVVYFVQGEKTGAIKIGYSREISKRFAADLSAVLTVLGRDRGRK